jgi:dipeptidyl-peptidase-4
MRRLTALLLLVAAPALAGDEPLTVERLFAEPPLGGVLPAEFTWLPGGTSFSYLERTGQGRESRATMWVEEAATGKRVALLTDEQLEPATGAAGKPRLAGAQWSPDGDALLLQGDGDLFRFERATGKVRRLTNSAAEEEVATFAPDGSRIAFVRANDLYALDLATGKETRISADGSADRFNGRLDWVYQEEIAGHDGRAYQWSSDSRSITYLTLDESGVPRFPHVSLTETHPTVDEQRYPKAGDRNPAWTLSVVSLTARPDGTLPRRSFSRGGDGAEYLPRFGWTPGNAAVWFELLDRDQTRLELVRWEVATGALTTLLIEEDAAWVNLHDDLHFFPDGSFLWSSERPGFRHLFVHEASGGATRAVTAGDWEVTQVEEIDEQGGTVVFTSPGPIVRERHVYRVNLDGTGLRRLTREAGSHRAVVAPGGRYVIDTWSRAAQPPIIRLLDGDGNVVRVLVANEHPEIEKYRTSQPEFFEVPGPSGLTLNAVVIKPVGFDPQQRYPVVVSVYGGPGSQSVTDAWSRWQFNQVLANRGFVVFTVDNRGTTGRGRDFERALLRRFGKVELEDHLAGVEWLKKLPWVDGERIGIWGGSYGGFMTCYALFNAPEVFRAGAAVASVTDWGLYDSIYTERYLKRPQDNPDGYRDSSPVNQADKLAGKLLLVHGTADDNVHWHNTLILADKLVQAGKPYELQLYAGATHRSYRPEQRSDEQRRVLEFLERHLK